MSWTVMDIVQVGLMASGHDGLVNRDAGCGCPHDDLSPAPGGCMTEGCEAGYKVEFPDGRCPGGECNGDCSWHIAAGDSRADVKHRLLALVKERRP